VRKQKLFVETLATIARFAEAEGLTIIAEFIEAESGKGADALDCRPQLAAALATAKSAKCAVLVSKLDRLSRDVAFVAGLVAELGRDADPFMMHESAMPPENVLGWIILALLALILAYMGAQQLPWARNNFAACLNLRAPPFDLCTGWHFSSRMSSDERQPFAVTPVIQTCRSTTSISTTANFVLPQRSASGSPTPRSRKVKLSEKPPCWSGKLAKIE
jgi:hypothetical protein